MHKSYVKYLEIDTSSYLSTSEGVVDKIGNFFWNFTSNPKAEELRDYVKLLWEKGLLTHRTEQHVKQRAVEFSRRYYEAAAKGEYGSSIKQYCDSWTRQQRSRSLDGFNRSFAYLFRNYQDLLERAARPQEKRKLAYCASALFAVYGDLSALYQEGESRYRAAKKRLDEAGAHKRTAQDESKIVVRNTEATIEIKGETDKSWQTIDEALDEMICLHRDGTMDNEKVVELSEKIKSKCEQLQGTYQAMKTTFLGLQSCYREVHALAQRASQSPYRDQVKQELQEVSSLDPEKKIADYLGRYRESGRDAGDRGVQGYQTRLENLAQTFEDFLAQQGKLQKLNELRQNVGQFILQVEASIQSLDSLKMPVEEVEHLGDIPVFFRSELESMRNNAQGLLSTVENWLSKYSLAERIEIDSLSEQLEGLRSDLIAYQENQDTFKEDVRQIRYELTNRIFSPVSFLWLGATYEKLLGDFRFRLQKTIQESYRAETYESAKEGCGEANEYIEQARQCLKEVSDLDNWFDQLERDFETTKFEGTSVQNRVAELARQIEDLKKELLQRFPKDAGKGLELLSKMQEDNRTSVDEELDELKSLAEEECESRIDEARRVVVQFEDSLSPIRVQIHQMLDQAVVQRKQGDFAQSLNMTNQAVNKMIGYLEQVQGSRSARLQVTLLPQPDLDFSEFVTAYEQRFGDQFDEEAGAELIRLLKEGKLHGTFSI